ncbi:MAG: T9SS type A sorting domain-containing protein [Flavobacteriales bacterium]|nr:T9SS type A sorting domain-containing protein [Flavobacteriales bacterium]
MKHVLLGLAAFSLSLVAGAQQYQCGSDLMRAKRIAEDPTYLEREAALEHDIRELMRNSAREGRDRDVIYTIPIVFHIINLGGSENITNEQILNQVDLLNEDYRALNADINNVHPAFTDMVGDAMIQFALPTIDPQGGCTNGIDRVRSPETLRGSDRAKMNPWPRDKYLNVWVIRDMADAGVAGYAYYPSAFDNPVTRIADGIIIENDYIGQIGTGTLFHSTALTHEVGHYLNLPHVWGNNNGIEEGNPPTGHMVADCGDDGVEDTPPTRGWNICPPYNDPTFGWSDCPTTKIDLSALPYRFDAVTTSSGTTDPTALEHPSDSIFGEPRQRADLSPFTAVGVGANSEVDGMFAFGGWVEQPGDGETMYGELQGTQDLGKYYAFSMDPRVTDLLYIDSIGFKVSRNAHGIRTFAVRSSHNNFASNIPLRVAANSGITIQTGNIAFINNDIPLSGVTVYADPPSGSGMQFTDQAVTFRLYAWNAENSNGRIRVCSNAAPVDMFDRLGGAPQPGGSWSGPSPSDGSFDPTTMDAGIYTYTVGANGPCPEYSATIEVVVVPAPDVPTITGNDSFCAGGSVVLTSSVTNSIRWSTGATTGTITVNTGNTYTVTQTLNTCSTTSDPFTVTSYAVVDAGTDGAMTLCETSGPADLFASIGSAPQTGGTWMGPSEVIDGLYDPTLMEPGVYEYALLENGACAADTARITVTETATANAGTDGTLSICNNRTADLFDRLGGAPQPGGSWTGPDSSPMDGMYDAVALSPGAYTYTVDPGNGCGTSSAVVTVSEITAPATPTITGTNAFCTGGTVQLASSSNQNNVWSNGVTTPGNNVTVAGTYTVRVNSSNGCFSVSAPHVVAEISPANAGGDAEIKACSASTDLDLFTALVGAPQMGGTWSGPSEVIDGLYQPASMSPGNYLYVVNGTSPCPNDSAIVLVAETNDLGPTTGYFGVDDVAVYGTTGLVENVENYMEYSYCSKMFSEGQVERMRFAAENATGERSNLWTDDNLRATGVAEGHVVACPPIADFYVRTVELNSTTQTQEVPFIPAMCTGAPVQFVDNSVGGLPTSWSWTFPGGNPATSTERNPVVTFDTPGFKLVSLTATNANGSNTKTNEFAFLIGGTPNDIVGTYFEGFENSNGLFPWNVMNYADNITSWRRTTTAGLNSNACAMLNSGERNLLDMIDPANGADYDDLYSPSFDLSGLTQASLTFNWAYSTTASDIANVTERLFVSISTDCGETWSLLPGGDLNTGTLINNGNNPQLPPPTWTERSLTISAARRVPNVRFRFRFISSEFTGNLYIDNIQIVGAVGIEDLSSENFMSLYPNPTNDQFTLGVHGMDKFATTVTITDLRGAVVYQNILSPTNLSMEFSAAELGLANGLYMINASNETGRNTQKLMVGR